MKHIYIMSSERSGSNLVRKNLGNHSKIIAPPPPHLLRHLHNNLYRYGDLSVDKNLRLLVSHAVKMVNIKDSHLTWNVDINVDEVLSKIKKRNLTNVVSCVYDLYTQKQNKNIWVSKENNLFDFADSILLNHQDSKFIYLVRDGRDVACSVLKVPSHDKEIYYIAEEWVKEQITCLNVYQEFRPHNNVFLLKYEWMLEDQNAAIQDLCKFLEIDYEPEMLNFFMDESSKQEAKKTDYWKNLSKPIITTNKNKYLRELSSRQIAVFNTVAKHVFDVLDLFLRGLNNNN